MGIHVKNRRSLARGLAAALLAFACVVVAACSDDEKDPITVRIFSYDVDFTATYVLNGGATVALPAGADQGSLYYGEFTLQDVDQVEVYVTTVSGSADYLAIRVYRNGVKVKESVASLTATLSLTYTYDEENVSGN